MPYMPLLMKELTRMGIENWVVTGSAQNILIDRIETDYSGSLSRERMVTAHDVKIGKPHPEPYLIALEKSGFKKNEVMVIENAPLGVQSGKAAGLFTIGLNSGPLDPKVLLDSGADLLFHNSRELASVLPEIVQVRFKYNQNSKINTLKMG
jgi:beta-phosphoglucomutase-like phosphatase (HAD superfamily)